MEGCRRQVGLVPTERLERARNTATRSERNEVERTEGNGKILKIIHLHIQMLYYLLDAQLKVS